MWKGVNSSSYVVWVTVPVPCLFIIIMVIRNLMLPGAAQGIKMYLGGYDLEDNPPNISEKLQNPDMWADACAQIFFSLGICMGTMTSYASFNPAKKPIIGDAFLIALTNSTISVVAGFAVFSVVGYLQHIESPVGDKVSSIGLAFIAYPAAIETMPWPNLWSVILSITLFTLGIDSAFSMLEACATVICDTEVGKKVPRKLLALLLCLLGACGSFVFSFNWGFTYFDVVDHYLTVYLMLLVGILEVFGAGWVYQFNETIAAVNTRTVYLLTFGYWGSLIIVGLLSFIAFPDYSWVGMIIFWVLAIVFSVLSFVTSGLSFGEWVPNVWLFGVKKLARAMTKLSKKEGDNEKKCWETVFEIWWGFMIKYFVPFALWWLLVQSTRNDLINDYGGYHGFWQIMGFLYPIGGLVAFIIPLFVCTTPEPFEHDIEEEFEEDNKAGSGQEKTAGGVQSDKQANADNVAI